jgi:insertion element IS1 protein InsB
MVMLPMGNDCFVAACVAVKAVKTRLPMPIRELAARRFCIPITNGVVGATWPARLGSLAQPCPIGSKKRSSASPSQHGFGGPRSRRYSFHPPELDELWSFVLKKANQVWVWIALCRKTRQGIAHVLGDRSKRTCQGLWESIPSAYRKGHCFTDFWTAYSAVIPDEQHTAVGKETGETAHVERWNTTLRQRLARFVRITLSFSKSEVMLRPRVCSSFFISTIESGPFCSSEQLPSIACYKYRQRCRAFKPSLDRVFRLWCKRQPVTRFRLICTVWDKKTLRQTKKRRTRDARETPLCHPEDVSIDVYVLQFHCT